MDELGVYIGQGKKEKVLIIYNKAVRYKVGKAFSRKSVMVTETIYADGHVILPLIIFKGKTHQMRQYLETTIPNSYTIGISNTAYTNNEIALKWIKHFNLYTQGRIKGAYRLLILNGHGSYKTLEFTQYCINQKILLAYFPLYLTHKMQPLNIVVFQLFKHWYSKAVNQAYRTGVFKIDKMEFLYLIPNVRKRTFKKATIKAVFAETGLYPFNPEKVLSKLPLPPKATLEKDPQITTINIIILKTLRQTSDLALYIRQNWEEQENEDLNKAIQKYVYRAEIQLQAFRSLKQQLKETKAENKQRQKQKANTIKVIQKFRVITVIEGRLLAKKRKVADKKKLANKRKKRAKTLTLEPKTPNNSEDEYSEWDKAREQQEDL